MDVITLGDVFIDVIMSGFTAMPKMGEGAMASAFHREIGGGAAITAAGLARLGFKTGLLALVGEQDSDFFINRLNGLGVDTSLVCRHPTEPTGFTVSVSTKEDRAFFSYLGANTGFTLNQLPGARMVHVAKRADDLPEHPGVFVSFDVGWHEEWFYSPAAWKVLSRVNLFFPNDKEGEALTGEKDPQRMLSVFEKRGLRRVALKLGSDGAVMTWEGKRFRAAPVDVEVKDTTGSGDCFDAGFLAGMLRDLDPQECLDSAVFCGAMASRVHGGVNGFPTEDEWRNRKRATAKERAL